MKTIIDTLKDAGVETVGQAVDALEDGELLASLGITDKDQESVEDLHADLVALKAHTIAWRSFPFDINFAELAR